MDTTETKFNLFRNIIEQFVPLSDDEWAIFRSHLRLSSIKKKELFIESGQICNYIGLIITGSIRYFQIKDGDEITGYFSIENELISAYQSFLTRKPSNNNIEALENTELILLSYQSMQELYNHKLLNYKMERFGRLVAEYLICCYDDRITSFVLQSPEERYLNLLAKNPNIIQRIPQHLIANFLGITPVSLSRIRRRIMEPVS